MPRIARRAPKGWIYHALNRAVARLPLFQKEADYEAFERVIAQNPGTPSLIQPSNYVWCPPNSPRRRHVVPRDRHEIR